MIQIPDAPYIQAAERYGYEVGGGYEEDDYFYYAEDEEDEEWE